jgi:outer membrane immunogenic protein
MKKVLLSIALAAGFANAAVAADLPVKARAMAPAPVAMANWTGCYVGAGGGYGMFNQDHRTLDARGIPFVGQVGDVTTGGRGWFGTVQAGCDYQFGQRWVVGAFGDWDFGSIKGNMSPALSNNTVLGEERLKNSWAAGGRLGYLVFPQLLTYISGGYTQARFDGVTFQGLAAPVTAMDAQTYKGWFLGSGVEYAIDFLPGLYWKTEYRFAQYQSERPALTGPIVGAALGLVGYEESKKYVQTIRTELVYRFNFGGGPISARY